VNYEFRFGENLTSVKFWDGGASAGSMVEESKNRISVIRVQMSYE